MSIFNLDFGPVSFLASTSASVNRASRISPSGLKKVSGLFSTRHVDLARQPHR